MKKQILSFLAAAAVTSCFAIAASAEVYDQVTLVYDEAASNETVKVVDVYCAGDYTFGGVLDFLVDGATISDYSFTTADGMFDAATVRGDWTDVENGQVGWLIVTKSGEPECFDGAPIATLTLTVPADTAAFTVELAGESYISDIDWNEDPIEYDTKITIPGAKVEDEEVTFDATPAGFFTYWQDAPAAKAFYATLTAEQAAKSVTWTVTDGSETKTADTTVDTTLTGENDVVIGLVVSNAVEGLTATVTVK